MAFNLKKVLRALLFSSSQALSVKDIQNLFARFHDQTTLPLEGEAEEVPAGPETDKPAAEAPAEPAETPVELPAAEASEAAADPVSSLSPEEAELYQDVPSLVTSAQIREVMAEIAEELRAANDIYLLIEGPTGYRVVTHPRFARWIRILRDEPPPVKLTQSALETLAIVAYRQPVTRTEIETIRGVSAEAGLNKLLERELVYITGRADLPGRPLQYGTTDKFLDFVGVKSLVELPASDVLSPRQIDEWLKNAINSKPPTEAEMGLPLEESAPEVAESSAEPSLLSEATEETSVPAEPAATSETPAAPEEDSSETPKGDA